jgi:CHAD domain-containing protein
MAFALLLTDASLQGALRRIMAEQTARILAALPADGTPPAATHDIRKRIKKMRALLRLVRSGLDDKVRHKANARLREAGRALSPARDAEVRLASFDLLMGADLAPDAQALRDHLALAAPAGAPPPDLRPLFADLADDAARWRLSGSDRRILAKGLAETHDRARATMLRAHRHRDPDRIHDWRKRVKDHGYQARLLTPVWPALMKPVATTTDTLAEALGDHRDIGLLVDHLADLPESLVPGDLRDQIAERAESARLSLESVAFPLGARMFAGDADDMAAQWLRWWKLWRAEAPEG